MRVFIPGFLLFCVYLLFARWYFVCEVRGLCDAPQQERILEPPRAQSLVLRSDGEIVLEGYDEFLFPKEQIEPVLNENNRAFLTAVTDYLTANPRQDLTIVGRYLRTEQSAPSGIYDNPGLARARAIEILLRQEGLSSERIFLNYAEMDADTLLVPIAFTAKTPKEGDYQRLQFSFEDMTYSEANFAFNSAEFRPRAGFVSYADSVKTFLDANPDYQLLIIGHTDSVDTEDYNEQLGLKRAEEAREYFLGLGVENEILALSKGETEPVAPNTQPDGSDNPEGRQRNRRVNFKLEPPETE